MSEPENPIAVPVVTVAMLLQDLAMTHATAEAEDGEPIHPHKPNDGELLTIEHRLVELLGWRRPTSSSEALAMVALAYEVLDVASAFEGPMRPKSFMRSYRLLRRALPVLTEAIRPEGVSMTIVDHFAHTALRDG